MQSHFDSLVQYAEPVVVSSTGGTKGKNGKGATVAKSKGSSSQAENVLHSILPPREWTEDGELWVQYVSSESADTAVINRCKEQFEAKLMKPGVRESGICPIREELHSQLFDELIRQVTIECPEQGLLLLRVKDEMRGLVIAYQSLYESVTSFGVREALRSEQQQNEMLSTVKQLESDTKDMRKQIAELENKIESVNEREKQRIETARARQQAESAQLKSTYDSAKAQLESLLRVPKD